LGVTFQEASEINNEHMKAGGGGIFEQPFFSGAKKKTKKEGRLGREYAEGGLD